MLARLTMVTPLCTRSGFEGSASALQITVLRSLRWWYSTIVCGMGGWACNPGVDQCVYRQVQDEDQEAALRRVCDACRLFGCPGWQRRFSLSVETGSGGDRLPLVLASLNEDGVGSARWLSQLFDELLDSSMFLGDLTVAFHFASGDGRYAPVIKGLLSLMAHHGSIGEGSWWGFGRFDWESKLEATTALGAIRSRLTTHLRPSPREGLTTWRRFWSLHSVISQDDPLVQQFIEADVAGDEEVFRRFRDRYLPVSPAIRRKLPDGEQALQEASGQMRSGKDWRDRPSRQRVDRPHSLVFISHMYRRRSEEDGYHVDVCGFTSDETARSFISSFRGIWASDRSRAFIGAHAVRVLGEQLFDHDWFFKGMH